MALLLSGIGLRLLYYFQNRSFFIDEAALASEIAQRSIIDFFAPLTYQFAPPFYSILTKMSTYVLGNTEYAFRLVPLLAGGAGLLLFYRYLDQKFSKELSWLGVAFFAIFLPMVRYGTEAKQYSTDVFFTILLFYLADLKWSKTDPLFFLKWALVGGLAVWFSMPSVFILTGVGLYYLYEFYRAKEFKSIKKYCLVIGFWLLNFGFYFWLILSNDLGRESLSNFHEAHFLPMFPNSLDELKRFGGLLLAPINEGLGGTFLAHLFAFVFSCAGIFNLWNREKRLLLLLIIPLVVTYLASSLGLYSLIGRMVLFLVPIYLILVSYGIQELFERVRGKIVNVVNLVGIVILANSKTLTLERFEVEAGREIMSYVAERRKADELIYVHHLGIETVNFYSKYSDNFRQDFGSFELINWDDNLTPIGKHAKVWMVTIHHNEELLKHLDTVFGEFHLQQDGIYLKDASARLYYKQ